MSHIVLLETVSETPSVYLHEHVISSKRGYYVPQLLPFNGTNPKSVVVMDNASIHHVDQVVTLIEDVGAIPIFLPPYSPDVMPIEECFSKVKAFLRANDSLIQVLKESEMEDFIFMCIC